MSDTERTHKTRILRVRQRRRWSKPSEDEDEAQTHHRTTAAAEATFPRVVTQKI